MPSEWQDEIEPYIPGDDNKPYYKEKSHKEKKAIKDFYLKEGIDHDKKEITKLHAQFFPQTKFPKIPRSTTNNQIVNHQHQHSILKEKAEQEAAEVAKK